MIRPIICDKYEPSVTRRKINYFIFECLDLYETEGQSAIVKVGRHLSKCRECAEYAFSLYSMRRELHEAVRQSKLSYVISHFDQGKDFTTNELRLKRENKSSYFSDLADGIFSLHELK